MYSRRSFGSIKSLLHFDFPHHYATNSGLKDEASPESWHLNGNANFAGKFPPVDVSTTNAPKFGYRSLHTSANSDYAYCANLNNTFKFNNSGPLEFELFFYLLTSANGNLITLMSGNDTVFTLSISSEKLSASSTSFGISITSSNSITINTWHHVRVSLSSNSCNVYYNANSIGTATISGTKSATVSSVRIGGINGYLDEFVYRWGGTSAGGVPTAPYQGTLDITKAGGFGTGRDGSLILSGSGAVYINTSAIISAVSNGTLFTHNGFAPVSSSVGRIIAGEPKQGDEVMLWVEPTGSKDNLAGLYAFRNIVSVSANSFTIDSPVVDEFDMDEALRYYKIIATKIPHFTTVTLNRTSCLKMPHYFIAFRATGNVSWDCYNSTYEKATTMVNFALSHSDLPDRILPSYANIMIFCGGTCSVTGRMGVDSNQPYRLGGYGGADDVAGQIMIGSRDSDIHGANILIAAKTLNVDSNSLLYGAKSATHYSGLCYLAGNLS